MTAKPPRYYDYDGNPISIDEWCWLFEARGSDPEIIRWRVAETHVNEEVDVSTVWLGLDHNYFGEGPPLIFETMVFGGPMDEECVRYSSAEEAEAGHNEMVDRVRLALQVEEALNAN